MLVFEPLDAHAPDFSDLQIIGELLMSEYTCHGSSTTRGTYCAWGAVDRHNPLLDLNALSGLSSTTFCGVSGVHGPGLP